MRKSVLLSRVRGLERELRWARSSAETADLLHIGAVSKLSAAKGEVEQWRRLFGEVQDRLTEQADVIEGWSRLADEAEGVVAGLVEDLRVEKELVLGLCRLAGRWRERYQAAGADRDHWYVRCLVAEGALEGERGCPGFGGTD